MTGVCILAVIFSVSLQPSRAAEFCEFFDDVVESIGENPPFAAVRYLDVPDGQCSVSNVEGHHSRGLTVIRVEDKSLEESLACVWHYPEMSGDARLEEARSRLNQANQQRSEVYRRFRELEELLFDMNTGSPDRGRVVAEVEHAEREWKRLRSAAETAEHEHGLEVARTQGVQSRDLHLRARKFVSSINSCMREGKIRGSWGTFEDHVRFDEERFTYGFWWIHGHPPPVGIAVFAIPEKRQLSFEVWKRR